MSKFDLYSELRFLASECSSEMFKYQQQVLPTVEFLTELRKQHLKLCTSMLTNMKRPDFDLSSDEGQQLQNQISLCAEMINQCETSQDVTRLQRTEHFIIKNRSELLSLIEKFFCKEGDDG